MLVCVIDTKLYSSCFKRVIGMNELIHLVLIYNVCQYFNNNKNRASCRKTVLAMSLHLSGFESAKNLSKYLILTLKE